MPHDYHHWVFRTQLKLKSAKQDNLAWVAQGVLEYLGGQALQVAMDVGIPELLSSGGSGIELLIDRVGCQVFPVAQREATDLYKSHEYTRLGRTGIPDDPAPRSVVSGNLRCEGRVLCALRQYSSNTVAYMCIRTQFSCACL